MPPSEADQAIDELLERYLVLVDQYTTLRAALTTTQQRMFHALARANFTADRGVRHYGQDQYDERMQASRRVAISAAASSSSSPPTFAIVQEFIAEEEEEDAEGQGKEDDSVADRKEKEKKKKKKKSSVAVRGNPIRWFGVLVPPALREAQSQSVAAVEDVIPRLVSVQAEMAHVEIEVRRARKKRAKASAAEVKKQDTTNTARTVSASS
ncbi:hypothetical protein LMH87_011704 [Akanthomyces muscarius]|uniref:Vacuolar ATPase assembly protein VMA22 n=1 Tax=Akanthomyces muscarius TaxID=2231603 RepID=A0A9W8UL98_AKAMU|nr:hypothetical protein LMH87_011704 [Akanthomyces muscarius]KAJ4150981.1 hypothetical protein LMH87_011704 [Akanthomyces muscarius]